MAAGAPAPTPGWRRNPLPTPPSHLSPLLSATPCYQDDTTPPHQPHGNLSWLPRTGSKGRKLVHAVEGWGHLSQGGRAGDTHVEGSRVAAQPLGL